MTIVLCEPDFDTVFSMCVYVCFVPLSNGVHHLHKRVRQRSREKLSLNISKLNKTAVEFLANDDRTTQYGCYIKPNIYTVHRHSVFVLCISKMKIWKFIYFLAWNSNIEMQSNILNVEITWWWWNAATWSRKREILANYDTWWEKSYSQTTKCSTFYKLYFMVDV